MLQNAVAPALAGLQSPNWYWITMQLIVPPLMALPPAWLFWRRTEAIFGNLVGTGVLLMWALALIFREYIEIDRAVKACFDTGELLCFVEPSAFARFAIYASIGLVETFLLFTISLAVERRISNRDYAPEWRR
jgi:hypothetical protein